MAALHLVDDIVSYMEHDHINNEITFLERSFVEMKVLKPIYTAESLLRIYYLKLQGRLSLSSFPRSIKWVPEISGKLVVKSKLPPWSGSSLDAVEAHKGP